METVVLGRNPDDKGAQLEALAVAILKHLGYCSITVNEISAGGHEIDVRAEYAVPSPGGGKQHPVICECKAHDRAIVTADWLKFLGKMFTEECCSRSQPFGCLIALGGANGNVLGAYRTVRETTERVELIAGERLFGLLQQLFDLPAVDRIEARVRSITERRVTSVRLCYYEKTVYWMVGFPGDGYSLLRVSGRPLSTTDVAAVMPAASSSAIPGSFVDLVEETLGKKRKEYIEKCVLAGLMLAGGKATLPALKTECSSLPADENGRASTPLEIEEALSGPSMMRFVAEQKGDGQYVLLEGADEAVLFEFYRFLLNGYCPAVALSTEFYTKHLTEEFMLGVCRVQDDLPLSERERSECLTLIRWSPGALMRALHPSRTYRTKNDDGSALPENLIRHSITCFRNDLATEFVKTFENLQCGHFLFSKVGLREVAIHKRLVVKSADGVVCEIEIPERMGILQADPTLGGGLVLVRLLKEAPEPWDIYRKAGDTTEPKSGNRGGEQEMRIASG